MNVQQFDEFVQMWDAEGQSPDVDWLEYAQDFRNQTQQLTTDNAALKRELELYKKEIERRDDALSEE